jgi:hypothetical protein
LDFTKSFLKSILFEGDPEEEQVAQIPFWRYDEIAKLSSSDIIIVEAAKHLIRKLAYPNASVLPAYVHHILDIRGDWQDVRKRFRKSVRHELRLTRKYGYVYEISHASRDFEMFYHDMYLPTMEASHGDLASPVPFNKAYQRFRQGLLFLVKRDGQRVCGSVCYLEQGMIHFVIMGVIDADRQLIREGAIGALNCLRIQWANQRGYKAVNFLGTNPFLNDSLFQFKRKWGTAISVPPHLHRQIWIQVRRLTPAVSQFLKETPFVVIDGDSKLHGLVTVDDVQSISAEDREKCEKRYATPGLNDLLIRSVDNWVSDEGDFHNHDLVIPIH